MRWSLSTRLRWHRRIKWTKVGLLTLPPVSLWTAREAAIWKLQQEYSAAQAHRHQHQPQRAEAGSGPLQQLPAVHLHLLPGGDPSTTAKGGIAEPPHPPVTQQDTSLQLPPSRPSREELQQLQEIAERCNLMGKIALDYDEIRKWHQNRNYWGGIVVRQLDYDEEGKSLHKGDKSWAANLLNRVVASLSRALDRALHLQGDTKKARRECYYLYYELCGRTGRRSYDVFIRGTTVWSDWFQNLHFRKVHDPELDRYLHAGFLRKSETLLADLEPLLTDREGVIRVHGHSLGGAMAHILGWKLARRGFQVEQVTSFGAPKFRTNWRPNPAGRRAPRPGDEGAGGCESVATKMWSLLIATTGAGNLRDLKGATDPAGTAAMVETGSSTSPASAGSRLGDEAVAQGEYDPEPLSEVPVVETRELQRAQRRYNDVRRTGTGEITQKPLQVDVLAADPDDDDRALNRGTEYVTVMRANDPVPFFPVEGPTSYFFKGGYVPSGRQIILDEPEPYSSVDGGVDIDQWRKATRMVSWSRRRTSPDVGLEVSGAGREEDVGDPDHELASSWLRYSFLVMPFADPNSHRLWSYINRLSAMRTA